MLNYIILDLEWNQSSAGKEKENTELPFEIVEIGAIKLDENKNIIGKYNQLIKPQVYLKMHYMTKKIVHLNMDELEEGKEFPAVIREFLDWCGEDYVFCTWGSLDLLELQRNMNYYNMKPLSGGPLKYYDIQKFFSIVNEDEKTRRTLEFAVDYLKIEKEEAFHRALIDAYYTALVFKELKCPDVEKRFSFDIYHTPASKKEEIYTVFDTYSKYISCEFKTKTLAMTDREVMSTRCFLCGKPAKKKVRWFSVNGKHYYCISYCEKHGYLRGKARMKKADSGNIYVVKTIKQVSAQEAENVVEKQDKLRTQRKYKRKAKK